MILYKANCRVCIRIKQAGGKELMEKIFLSSAFVPRGITMQSIRDEYGFTQESLHNHCKRHQFKDPETAIRAMTPADIEAQAKLKVQTKILTAGNVWDTVIEHGLHQLQAAGKPITTADLLRAAKDKSDFEAKQKDQQIATLEMVMHFASRESDVAARLQAEKPAPVRIQPAVDVTKLGASTGMGPGGELPEGFKSIIPTRKNDVEEDKRAEESHGDKPEGDRGLPENALGHDQAPEQDAQRADRERQRRSSAFYERVTGYATPPGRDGVSGGDPAPLQSQD